MSEPVLDPHPEPQPSAEPVFTVVKGHPTDEELGAVLAVLTARSASAERSAAAPVASSGWAAYWRAVRAPLPPGAGAWRASGR